MYVCPPMCVRMYVHPCMCLCVRICVPVCAGGLPVFSHSSQKKLLGVLLYHPPPITLGWDFFLGLETCLSLARLEASNFPGLIPCNWGNRHVYTIKDFIQMLEANLKPTCLCKSALKN